MCECESGKWQDKLGQWGTYFSILVNVIGFLDSMDKVQTELDHSENGTHSLWFTKLTTALPAKLLSHTPWLNTCDADSN